MPFDLWETYLIVANSLHLLGRLTSHRYLAVFTSFHIASTISEPIELPFIEAVCRKYRFPVLKTDRR